MASNLFIRQCFQPWHVAVCLGVGVYLLLGAVTHTLRLYHWFLLFLIPAAVLAAERGRRFFLEWSPLFAFWLGYDRLRLVQPHLLSRIAVETPYRIECALFGWIGNGQAPAHAARAFLANHTGEFFATTISMTAQLVYLSHVFLFPGLMLFWWLKGRTSSRHRQRFHSHLIAFTILNFGAILCYLLMPVAPPWWISLHAGATPTLELLAHTDIMQAMDGALVQRMIATAPMWFGAVPSLHGAYPVLLWLLARRERRGRAPILLAIYAAMMWAATVMLNQHYLIDLLAGAAFAWAAYLFALPLLKKYQPVTKPIFRCKDACH